MLNCFIIIVFFSIQSCLYSRHNMLPLNIAKNIFVNNLVVVFLFIHMFYLS
jgi:hypothetical protein